MLWMPFCRACEPSARQRTQAGDRECSSLQQFPSLWSRCRARLSSFGTSVRCSMLAGAFGIQFMVDAKENRDPPGTRADDFTTSRHPGCFHQLQGCSTSAISWKAGSMVLAAFRDPGVAGACRPVGAYTGTVGAHQVCSLQAMARGRSFPGAWEKGLGPRKSFNRRQTRHRLLPE